MREKVCVFNWSGLIFVFTVAVGASLMISIDSLSLRGDQISWLEVLRAVCAGAVAVGGFFTKQTVEASEVNDGE